MTVYVWTDSDGRVGAVTDDVRFSDGATAVEHPDVPGDATIFDYVLRDGTLIYDPLPEPELAPDPVAIATEAKQTADEAKATVEEAKQTAETAAASMNEYMDALLGLDATDETEATDAE